MSVVITRTWNVLHRVCTWTAALIAARTSSGARSTSTSQRASANAGATVVRKETARVERATARRIAAGHFKRRATGTRIEAAPG